ncbi:hypothetical protein DE146DRAFT_757343 [Phaeosphaeria sp. MPI-PUGE-AT-0046c]|nr:hypothetical protein DE146DRAFT_757343 [Phaeosphaeria sp. MPI-PUGE-AT-0046c]
MVVHKSRGSARRETRRKPISLGGRALRLLVGPSKRQFTVHEDMRCTSSQYFKYRFDPRRKGIEGDCSICTESLCSHEEPLTWCKTCGNNAHKKFIQDWTNRNKTCPMCRAPWAMRNIFDTIKLAEWKAEAFDAYVQWLYTGTISEYEEDISDSKRFTRMLGVSAQVFGEALQDPSFVNAAQCDLVIGFFKNVIGSQDFGGYLQIISVIRASEKVPRAIVDGLAELFLKHSKEPKDGGDIFTRLTEAGYLEKVKRSNDDDEGSNE